MKIGIVGLGRMGGNIARRLMAHGHSCVVYDANASVMEKLAADGAETVETIAKMVLALPEVKFVWLMLPAGKITEDCVEQLGSLLSKGDVILDGGNAYFKDDVRRAQKLARRGIDYLDVGTSGGVWGLERGYCLMVGGKREVFEMLDPIFKALAPGRGTIPPTPGRQGRDTRVEEGYLYCGPSGAGRFAKMVHNGIEYGLMQAYAEGLDIVHSAADDSVAPDYRYSIDLADLTEVWRRGSVISSWLLDLSAAALAQDSDLQEFSGKVNDSGEGRWTLMAAIEEGVPADVLSAALFSRFRSRQKDRIADKLLSAMRHEFGGHVESDVTKFDVNI